jgi:SAM-dependent methyltransferase
MQHLANCPACGGPTGKAKVVRQHHSQHDEHSIDTQLVECRCGHVFTNPQPSWDELAPFYGVDYGVFAKAPPDATAIDKWITTRSFNGRFNHMKILPGGRYLDVGCGLGVMVAAMSRLGMKAEGVEPSPIAAQKAREAGLIVFCGILEEAKYDSESFDCISMFHVLEHTHDPVELLRECRRILKPGGELIVGVPNYNSLVLGLVGSIWSALDQPRHLQHFRPGSIRRTADRAGLRISAIETESLVDHVEGELIGWLRRRFFIPSRLISKTRAARPLAAGLAGFGNKSGRGEAIVARMEKSVAIN